MSLPDSAVGVNYIEIQATDGFGLLKDDKFEAQITSLSRISVVEWISRVLNRIIHETVLDEYDEYDIITTASVWYEDSMDSSVVTDPNYGDPLMNTLINESAFVEVNEFGEAKGYSYYDILQHICDVFNFQISQANGRFLLIQENTYTQEQTRAWNYDMLATFISTRSNLAALAPSSRFTFFC